MATIYAMPHALVGLESGRAYRRCAEPIERTDAFGLSEAVRRACRREEAPG